MKEEKKLSKKKQYLISAAIILLACGISAIILLKPFQMSGAGNKHTVSFYDDSGGKIETQRISDGKPVRPPELERDGCVFRGWSREMYSVKEDMDVYPQLETLSDAKNAVYSDCVYSDIGDDVTVKVKLGGAVDCCDFVIELAYDAAFLKCEGTQPLLDGLEVTNDEEKGIITLKYSGAAELKAAVALAEIRFSANEKEGAYCTELAITTREIHAGADKAYTDSTAYSPKLYLIDF